MVVIDNSGKVISRLLQNLRVVGHTSSLCGEFEGAGFGVGVGFLAIAFMAARNQAEGANFSSSGVNTGGLKTDDKSFGKGHLLRRRRSASLRVFRRVWFWLKAANPILG